MKPFVRNPYNYDMNAAGDESGLKCEDPTLTQQHFKDDSDINTIVERFHITGELPQNIRMPSSYDFAGVFDFQSAMDTMNAARKAFQAMPAIVRARFDNDPAEFVQFCDDPQNLEEALKLGLVPEAPKPKPEVTPPVPPKD